MLLLGVVGVVNCFLQCSGSEVLGVNCLFVVRGRWTCRIRVVQAMELAIPKEAREQTAEQKQVRILEEQSDTKDSAGQPQAKAEGWAQVG